MYTKMQERTPFVHRGTLKAVSPSLKQKNQLTSAPNSIAFGPLPIQFRNVLQSLDLAWQVPSRLDQ
jgi:hypothetical protein